LFEEEDDKLKNKHNIIVLPGDGIGPEVITSAIKVLKAVQKRFNLKFNLTFGNAGFGVIEKSGTNLPKRTIKLLKKSDACIKGPMTTPEGPESEKSAAVKIRNIFDLYANVRPCKSYPKTRALRDDIDLIIVRENTEGMYYGKEKLIRPGVAKAERLITRKSSDRIAKFAFELAIKRKRHLTYVHKANILKITDGIFNSAVQRIANEVPSVRVDNVHVDNMASQLVKNPQKYDVIVTTNMYGDILSDLAAQVVGGLGLVPSANIGKNYGMFEPIHGSAPKYAGKNKVNPIASILAIKMMLEYLGENSAAHEIDYVVTQTLQKGKVRTFDLGGKSSTSQMTDAIVHKLI